MWQPLRRHEAPQQHCSTRSIRLFDLLRFWLHVSKAEALLPTGQEASVALCAPQSIQGRNEERADISVTGASNGGQTLTLDSELWGNEVITGQDGLQWSSAEVGGQKKVLKGDANKGTVSYSELGGRWHGRRGHFKRGQPHHRSSSVWSRRLRLGTGTKSSSVGWGCQESRWM